MIAAPTLLLAWQQLVAIVAAIVVVALVIFVLVRWLVRERGERVRGTERAEGAALGERAQESEDDAIRKAGGRGRMSDSDRAALERLRQRAGRD